MAPKKKALITGITGQDGSYLTEFLLRKNYEVHGVIRRTSSFNTHRILHVFQDPHEKKVSLFLHYGELSDGSSLERILAKVMPDEIYHLGAQSHVRVSFDVPLFTADATGLATLRLLEAIRHLKADSPMRFYQASSSEMFGSSQPPQSETTVFSPRSPYAAAKVFAFHSAVNYREAFGLHVSNGILFNHESPRRGATFVTRKITRALAQILAKKEQKIYLGNLDAKRDWGFAGDYVEAMWLMLQQPKGDDYVIATGESYSVREFLNVAFALVGLDWNKHVEFDARYLRPTEVDHLCGDPSKAMRVLGWKPKTKFKDLVRLMVHSDLKNAGIDPRDFGLENKE